MRILVPTLALVAIASSCTINTDYFGDYRGVNLISAYDFDNAAWALERHEAYEAVVGYDPTDYMTWEEATDLSAVGDTDVASLSVGPDGTSPAYRLEIKNLFQDGDFENGQSGSAFATPDTGWWSTPGAPGTLVQFGTGGFTTLAGTFSSVANTSLLMSGEPFNRLDIDLRNAFLSTALYDRKGSYQFWFDFFHAAQNSEVFDLSIVNQDVPEDWRISGLKTDLDDDGNADIDKTTNVYTRGHFFSLDGNPTDSTITLGGKNSTNQAVLDNFRVVNSDINPFVAMALPSLNSGTLPLLSGQKSGAYLLKFWVHDDPTADQTNVVHVLNRLQPAGVGVWVTAATKSGSGDVKEFIARPAGGWPTWTQITIPLGFDFVNFDDLIPVGESALVIAISPTNTKNGAPDAGSLLIAQPSFEFNP